MLTTAAVLFALAALGGLPLASLHFLEKRMPMPLALLHGGLGAAGLVTLGWAVLKLGAGAYAVGALIVFMLAALGGFFLFTYYLRRQRLPSPVVVIHGSAAVVAFLLLLTAIMKA